MLPPQAAKAFIVFTLEAENYDKWLQSAVAYLTHPLNAYDANPVWTSDKKLTVGRDVAKRTLTAGHLGSVGEKAASALADFVVLAENPLTAPPERIKDIPIQRTIIAGQTVYEAP